MPEIVAGNTPETTEKEVGESSAHLSRKGTHCRIFITALDHGRPTRGFK
jgi:hypothetical protein